MSPPIDLVVQLTVRLMRISKLAFAIDKDRFTILLGDSVQLNGVTYAKLRLSCGVIEIAIYK